MGRFFDLTFEAAESYVRHMAWLSATPDKSNVSRAVLYRGTALAEIEPDPICNWLVQCAIECGMCGHTGMGSATPVSWTDVHEWAVATGQERWTMIAVRKLSECYVDQAYKAKDPACPAPLDADIEKQRAAVVSQLKRFASARR